MVGMVSLMSTILILQLMYQFYHITLAHSHIVQNVLIVNVTKLSFKPCPMQNCLKLEQLNRDECIN